MTRNKIADVRFGLLSIGLGFDECRRKYNAKLFNLAEHPKSNHS